MYVRDNGEIGPHPAGMFGTKLRVARALHDMSLRDVADRVDVTAQQISKYENGRDHPKSSVLVALAKLYGVSLDWLMCDCPVNLGWHQGECADGVQRRAEMRVG